MVKKILSVLGYEVTNSKRNFSHPIAELDREEMGFIDFVESEAMTMVSRFRLIATAMAVKYALESGLEGDFVECGVYRGGNAILARKLLDYHGDNRLVWLFDTFSGMTQPTSADRKLRSGKMATEKWQDSRVLGGGGSSWCLASLEEVKGNIEKAGLELKGFRFVVGDVLQTLSPAPQDLGAISVLRLDTDWYESTKTELQILYPLLVRGGVLLIDDYGAWEGAKKAVDEYFLGNRPFMSAVDHTGRSLVKP